MARMIPTTCVKVGSATAKKGKLQRPTLRFLFAETEALAAVDVADDTADVVDDIWGGLPSINEGKNEEEAVVE